MSFCRFIAFFLWFSPIAPSSAVFGEVIRSSLPLIEGFAKIPHVSSAHMDRFTVSNPQVEKGAFDKFCAALQKKYKEYRWGSMDCSKIPWKMDYLSRDGYPLIYSVFGSGSNTTIFLGGVHPDELTPVHLAFRLAQYLKDHPDVLANNNAKVIVAPLVNPDGFLIPKPLRTNKLVDVNRNFSTYDWYGSALTSWIKDAKAMPRYFPGYFPNTEIETIFQAELLSTFKPHKIFSIHAPLGFLDYDGPKEECFHDGTITDDIAKNPNKKDRRFVHMIAEKSNNYRVVDFSYYPGSLGNFAGNERHTPTVTLELETSSPEKVEVYWSKFLPGFLHSIKYQFVMLSK